MRTSIFPAMFIAAVLALGGCASTLTGDTYSRHEARTPQAVQYGVIEELRPVQIEGTRSGIGAGAGAYTGAIAASSIGDGRTSAVAAVIGALLGGLIGAATEEGFTTVQGVEITVIEDDGAMTAIVQEVDPNQKFRVGDPVRILTNVYGDTRVTHR